MLEEEIGEPFLAQATTADVDAASRRSDTVLATALTSSASLVRSQLLISSVSDIVDQYE